MPRLSNQELAALLEAASKGPWEAVRNAVVLGTRSVLFDEEAGDADLALAAQAPDLAQEVLDQRRVGEELVGTQRSDATEIHGSRHASYSFDDCPTAFCVERRALIARWAKLTETEPRAG